MSEPKQDLLQHAALEGTLLSLLNEYLTSCHTDTASKKKSEIFPNLAGFCRWLGCGVNSAEKMRKSHPELYDRVCAALEDEALNSSLSPTVLSAYLKQRLGYGEKAEAPTSQAECGQLRLIFEHDIEEDGT